MRGTSSSTASGSPTVFSSSEFNPIDGFSQLSHSFRANTNFPSVTVTDSEFDDFLKQQNLTLIGDTGPIAGIPRRACEAGDEESVRYTATYNVLMVRSS